MSDQTTSLPTHEPDGQFHSYQHWVNKATSWIGGTNPLCADAKDRICRNGGDMMRAHDEGAFPVRFWYGAGPAQTSKQRRKSQSDARKALKLLYPWR